MHQLDIDAKRRLVHARNLSAFMLGVTATATTFSNSATATIVLVLNAGIWLTWFIDKTATLRELSLLQGDE